MTICYNESGAPPSILFGVLGPSTAWKIIGYRTDTLVEAYAHRAIRVAGGVCVCVIPFQIKKMLGNQ